MTLTPTSSRSSGAGTQTDTPFTAPVTVSGTTSGTADTVVTSPAITCTGGKVDVEFYAPSVQCGAASSVTIELWQDGAMESVIAYSQTATSGPVRALRTLTPTAGSHTWVVKAYRGAANGSIAAGAGGGAGASAPGLLRITVY